MAEQLSISSDPAIIVPDGLPALHGKQPFPVAVGDGEMYFVPARCNLEPRVRAATFLALLGETNKTAGKLLQVSEYTAKRDILEGVHSFGLTDRFDLPYYGFSQGICCPTKRISPYDNLLPRMTEVFDALGREGVTDGAVTAHIVPRTMQTYQDLVSKRTGVKGGRNRLVLMGIMSGQVGDFKTTTAEAILASQQMPNKGDAS